MYQLGALYADYRILSGQYPEESGDALLVIAFIRSQVNGDEEWDYLRGSFSALSNYLNGRNGGE